MYVLNSIRSKTILNILKRAGTVIGLNMNKQLLKLIYSKLFRSLWLLKKTLRDHDRQYSTNSENNVYFYSNSYYQYLLTTIKQLVVKETIT